MVQQMCLLTLQLHLFGGHETLVRLLGWLLRRYPREEDWVKHVAVSVGLMMMRVAND